MIYKGQPFWIGAVALEDGEIEEVHPYETASEYDFHHSFYFSDQSLKRYEDGNVLLFWANKPRELELDWRRPVGTPAEEARLKKRIIQQIQWNS